MSVCGMEGVGLGAVQDIFFFLLRGISYVLVPKFEVRGCDVGCGSIW